MNKGTCRVKGMTVVRKPREYMCERCGVLGTTTAGRMLYCPKCKQAIISEKRRERWLESITTRTCEECGVRFTGGPKARYCHKCRDSIRNARIVEGVTKWHRDRSSVVLPPGHEWYLLVASMSKHCKREHPCETCTIRDWCPRT